MFVRTVCAGCHKGIRGGWEKVSSVVHRHFGVHIEQSFARRGVAVEWKTELQRLASQRLPEAPGSGRIVDMFNSRRPRTGCVGCLGRIVLLVMLGIVVLICVANRAWLHEKALNAIYDDRPQIHAGKYFNPGGSAVEDGVRQTAVLIDGKPHVRVESPTDEWHKNHKDAKCKDDVCTAAATPEEFVGAGGIDIGAIIAGLLVCYLFWIIVVGDDDDDRFYRRGGRYGRRYDDDRY